MRVVQLRLLVKIPLILFALVGAFLFVTIVLPVIHFSTVWTDRAVYAVGEPVTVYWSDAALVFSGCQNGVELYKQEDGRWQRLVTDWNWYLGCLDGEIVPQPFDVWPQQFCPSAWGGVQTGNRTFSQIYQCVGNRGSCWWAEEKKYVYNELREWEPRTLPSGLYRAQYHWASADFEIR